MKVFYPLLLLVSIFNPLLVRAGGSSSAHPFPAPKAFTLIFHDVEPTEQGLKKYSEDIKWTEKVLSNELTSGSLVTFQKRIIPLTKKLVTPEAERSLFTLCAALTDTETSQFKPPTYFRVRSEVFSGIDTDSIRVVETQNCEVSEIQNAYSEYQWSDKNPKDQDQNIANAVRILCEGENISAFIHLEKMKDQNPSLATVQLTYNNETTLYEAETEFLILEIAPSIYQWQFSSPSEGMRVLVQTSEMGAKVKGEARAWVSATAASPLRMRCTLQTYH